MRLKFPILIMLLGTSKIATCEEIAGYLTFSAGETVRSINNTASPLTGIYHIGAKGAWPSEYWEIGLLIEAGAFNRHPAFGSVGEVKLHYPLLRENIRLGFGGGIDFQSYYRGNDRGRFEEAQGYSHRFSPMFVGQIQVFKKLFIEYQKNMDEMIFWKARIGYKLWRQAV